MAERVGFEPTAPCGVTGFQDQLLKPLGHLSILIYYSRFSLEYATIGYQQLKISQYQNYNTAKSWLYASSYYMYFNINIKKDLFSTYQ